MCKGEPPSSMLGLFRTRSSQFPVILAFDHETATWSSTHLQLDLPEDIVQIALIPDYILALTSSGRVLTREVDGDQTNFVLIEDDCIKLLQAGTHCFGFFKRNDGKVAVKRFSRYLQMIEDLGISMGKYFASSARVEQDGNMSLYVAGEDFDTPTDECRPQQPQEGQTSLSPSTGLLHILVDPSGSLLTSQLHDIFTGPGCSMDVQGDIVSLWMRGLREVVRLNGKTLSVDWVEFVAHKWPLVNQFVYPNEAILYSLANHQFLFHRKSFMTSNGETRDLKTYQLQFSNNEQQRYWRHVSSFFQGDLLSICDGKFAYECEKL